MIYFIITMLLYGIYMTMTSFHSKQKFIFIFLLAIFMTNFNIFSLINYNTLPTLTSINSFVGMYLIMIFSFYGERYIKLPNDR